MEAAISPRRQSKGTSGNHHNLSIQRKVRSKNITTLQTCCSRGVPSHPGEAAYLLLDQKEILRLVACAVTCWSTQVEGTRGASPLEMGLCYTDSFVWSCWYDLHRCCVAWCSSPPSSHLVVVMCLQGHSSPVARHSEKQPDQTRPTSESNRPMRQRGGTDLPESEEAGIGIEHIYPIFPCDDRPGHT